MLLLVDARAGLTDDVRAIATRLREHGGHAWLLLNKLDLIDPRRCCR